MKNLNSSRKVTAILFICIFAVMLLCNALTLKCADDYEYCFNFLGTGRVDSVFDIFPSMKAHRVIMNGRVSAHFLVQLFLLLPEFIFKGVNAFVYTLQVYLIYKLAVGKRHNNLILLSVFCALWYFTPAFGQVNLWLDGSLNYLWSITSALIFILPFVRYFLGERPFANVFSAILSVIFAFFAGGWLENTSAAAIFTAALLFALSLFWKKRKLDLFLPVSLVLSVLGYVYMATAPGTLKNKAMGEMSIASLRGGFVRAMEMFESLWALWIVFAVLAVFAVCKKKLTDKAVLAFVFFAASLVSNFILTVASYYPERSAVAPVAFLVLANAVMAFQVFEDYTVPVCAIAAVMAIYGGIYLVYGVNDVYNSYILMNENENRIEQSIAEGDFDVELPMFAPDTKYSAVYGLKYLDTETTNTWPNAAMSLYYGADSIIGYWE